LYKKGIARRLFKLLSTEGICNEISPSVRVACIPEAKTQAYLLSTSVTRKKSFIKFGLGPTAGTMGSQAASAMGIGTGGMGPGDYTSSYKTPNYTQYTQQVSVS
jgi:hypothetical protein